MKYGVAIYLPSSVGPIKYFFYIKTGPHRTKGPAVESKKNNKFYYLYGVECKDDDK